MDQRRAGVQESREGLEFSCCGRGAHDRRGKSRTGGRRKRCMLAVSAVTRGAAGSILVGLTGRALLSLFRVAANAVVLIPFGRSDLIATGDAKRRR